MNSRTHHSRLLWLALALLAISPRPAHAYLDPSTGSMVLSTLVAIGATLALGVRTYWHRLLSWGRSSEGHSATAEPEPPASERSDS